MQISILIPFLLSELIFISTSNPVDSLRLLASTIHLCSFVSGFFSLSITFVRYTYVVLHGINSLISIDVGYAIVYNIKIFVAIYPLVHI